MPLSKFGAAISAVDWRKNIAFLLADTVSAERLVATNLRLAIWARQFETADRGNPALSYIREMQIAGQHVAVLIALALYRPAAGSIRAMLEAALYYTYFRTHPSELETLARGGGYYADKRDILAFHKDHTAHFGDLQQKLGVITG